ncbi:MAG: tRNA pseudouridine(55) synthase TruB [Bacteroidales bacterium]|nr:tRNA pseudouridine(55) synthase TruB [Bacteroidales bacterium]
MAYDFITGEILLINKPIAWTSFDIVNKIRYLISGFTGIRKMKVGHAGTLDPLATGLLIVCTGKFTKKIDEFQNLEKEYTGIFHLGATTPSFDRETEIDAKFETAHITEEFILKTATEFTGDMEQVPPAFSAVNVNGERAYNLARKKEEVKLKPRKVTIKEFEITRIELPEVHFRVLCSKGTYIRSLARDFGTALNSGAYLSQLTRTKIGSFTLEQAKTIEEFENQLSPK